MKKKIFAVISFSIIGFALLQIPFWDIVGSNQKFSLFDFFAPTIGLFITSFWGALAVVVVKVGNVIVHGQAFDTTTIIRLFPLALGALYFGARRYQKLVALIPVACLVLFNLHPEGRAAWYYSLYWLIPIVAAFSPRSLAMKSLGASFTAHSIGSVAFLYAFNLPSEVWIALIPIVFLERMLFTAGTAISYVALNSLVNAAANRFHMPALKKFVQPEYTFSRQLLSNL